jgi:carbohydrate-selective porin OprB
MIVAMTGELRPPATVEVMFGRVDYAYACERYGGDDLLDEWKALGDRLARRFGWQFHIDDDKAAWVLGSFGEEHLVITVAQNGHYTCFDAGTDTEVEATDTDAVAVWLEDREACVLHRPRLRVRQRLGGHADEAA